MLPSVIYAQTLTIVSWNLQWLSTKNDKIHRQQNDFKKIKQTLELLRPDILAFQEVDSVEVLTRILPDNQYTLHMSARLPTEVSASGNHQRETKQSQQYTGFAIKEGIEVTRQPDLSRLSSSSGLRNGTYVVIDAPEPIHLLNVHLKSGCFTDMERRKKACTTLRQQFTVLTEWINHQTEQQQHYMMIGDFNHRLSANDWFYTWKENRIHNSNIDLLTEPLNASCYARSKRGGFVRYDELIDHAITDKALGMRIERFGSINQYQIALKDIERFVISDHCPISVRVPL